MGLFGQLNPFVFILALGVGLFLTYITVPPPTVVIKFPSPSNAGKVTYRGEGDECYRYIAEKVSCEGAATKDQPVDGHDEKPAVKG